MKELVKRGFDVIAFSREKAGIKGKMGKEDVQKVCEGDRREGQGERAEYGVSSGNVGEGCYGRGLGAADARCCWHGHSGTQGYGAGTDIARLGGMVCRNKQDAESMLFVGLLPEHGKAMLLFDCLHSSLPLLPACLDTSAMRTQLQPAPHSPLPTAPRPLSLIASRAPSHAPFRSSLAPPCASAT